MADASNSERAEAERARRIPVRFQAEFVGRQVEGSGTVSNISLTGALIEDCSSLLLSDGDIKLRFSFFENSSPVEVRAKTVRETETGFAVRFVGMDARVKAILARAIADSASQSDSGAVAAKRPLFGKR